MERSAHLHGLAAGQRCDVTEVRDAAQLAAHGHGASLPGVLLALGHVETHQHRLLVVFPVKDNKAFLSTETRSVGKPIPT